MSDAMTSPPGRWLEGWRQGPRRTRWEHLPPQFGDDAPDAELLDSDSVARRLSEFWTDRPALILFWRHYGCSCGMDRAERLRDEHAAYVEAGANVVIVGQGEPERANAYAIRQTLPCPVLCDPRREVYAAYGLLQGTEAQILFDAPDELLQRDPASSDAFIAGRRGTERELVDDPWQLPGEFVVGTDGRIELAYRYQYCEDYPDPRVLVVAIRRARGELEPAAG